MHSKITGVGLSGLLVLAVGAVGQVGAADAKATAKVNYQEHVSAIFKNRCNSCHNADKQKGGLNLETYGSAMRGGGSGEVIEPGDLEASSLWLQVTHQDEPIMPPNSPKIPDAELEVIKGWIEAGAPETSGSVVAVKAKPKFEFKLDPSAMGKPAGPAAMPENLPTEPVVVSARPTAIVAMATSPWAPARRRRRAQAGPALRDERPPPGRRPPLPRGDDPRPEVQPQRRPPPGRRRPGRPVGPRGRLRRQDGQARLRDRQGV